MMAETAPVLIGKIVDIDRPMVIIIGTIADDDNAGDCVIKIDSTNDKEETTATTTYITSIPTDDWTKQTVDLTTATIYKLIMNMFLW